MKTNTIYFFTISAILLCISLLFFWYVRGGIVYKTEVVKEYYQKEKQSNLGFDNTIKKDMEELVLQESKIKEKFLEKDKIVDFIKRIESTAAGLSLGVTVQDIKYGDAEIVAERYSVSPILFNIQLSGDFFQIEQFAEEIVLSKTMLNINEFKIYKSEDPNLSKYSARITITGTTISHE